MYQEKDSQILEKRLIELSRTAYQRDIITYTDFLSLNEQHILHTLPKDRLYTGYRFFGGYRLAERQMAAFIPDALSLREWEDNGFPCMDRTDYPFHVVRVSPLNKRFTESLTHRDYLGAVLNLGIERSKIGDILCRDHGEADLFVHKDLTGYLIEHLTRVRHTSVRLTHTAFSEEDYQPEFEEIKGTVASVRLDSLLSLAFSSSRTKLTGLIEGAKVFVNGKLITSNGYHPKEGDIVSVRGMGKFRYESTGNKTKKDRTYVTLHKYI